MHENAGGEAGVFHFVVRRRPPRFPAGSKSTTMRQPVISLGLERLSNEQRRQLTAELHESIEVIQAIGRKRRGRGEISDKMPAD
jgi:hypothetical protein